MKKLVTALVFAFLVTGCGPVQEEQPTNQPDQQNTKQSETVKQEVKTAQADSFALWQDNEIDFTPAVPSYEIKDDLSNVAYTKIINGPDSAKEYLAKNGFVVSEGWNDEYFSVYEDNRYQYIPSFITTDSVLHTYHLYFDFLLKSLEENELYDLAYNLSSEMQKLSLQQYNKLKDTDWENSAKRNVTFFTVVMVILDGDKADIPEFVANNVNSEIKSINLHKGLAPSLAMGVNYLEDFSQYIPRGHYTKTEQLKRYFKALMYYGRMTFRLKEKDEVRSALLIVESLKNNDDARNDWKKLYEPIGFFVGDPDDLVYLDYAPVAKKVYGDDFTVDTLTQNNSGLDSFIADAKTLRDPGVNSMPILGTVFEPERTAEEKTEEIKGFRFMGQRFTIDAYVFQKLICSEVGNLDGSMECPKEDSRMLPNGLDIPSVMGSKLAYKLLDEMGETGYEKYPENMKKLQNGMKELPKSQWTENLYWGWIYTLNTLGHEYGEGYPSFMQSDEWGKKELNTYLGSWAELKHDTILYAKQVYAELGGGPMIDKNDDRGYVEPNPDLYARLASLTQFTVDGLKDREILSNKNQEQLGKLKDMLIRLRDISVKELENTDLTDDEYEFIRAYGGSLEHFWDETFTDKEKENDNLLNDNPAPIIADVATNPNCCVLEVGTGHVEPIYVVFPIDGELRVGKGGVYSYYEFSWPMADRLTDEKWRDEILWDNDKRPDRPSWQTFVKFWE
ncbi:DUF3160 domain-containing protein [bacterium]|nr:DUF3160 domain-containing protein [bacterium]